MDNPSSAEAASRLLRVEDAAAHLGIARTSMYRLVATREVESVLIGRLRRVPVSCLDDYVERLLREQATPIEPGGQP